MCGMLAQLQQSYKSFSLIEPTTIKHCYCSAPPFYKYCSYFYYFPSSRKALCSKQLLHTEHLFNKHSMKKCTINFCCQYFFYTHFLSPCFLASLCCETPLLVAADAWGRLLVVPHVWECCRECWGVTGIIGWK